jgi:hypothetical protein
VTTFLPSANLLSLLKSFTKSAKDSVKRPDEDEHSIESKLRIMARRSSLFFLQHIYIYC